MEVEENVCDHDSCLESSAGRDGEKMEALGLLDENWFFGNFLKKGTRMSRCYSDPCSSSNFNPSPSAASTKEGKALARVPSLPPYFGKEGKIQEKKSSNGKGKVSQLTRRLSVGNLPQAPKPACTENKVEIQEKGTDGKRKSRLNGDGKSFLLRTPSLPASLGREELIEENENDIRMSKLIWQAWANSSEIQTPKAVNQSTNIFSRSRPPRNIEAENAGANAVKETRPRSLNQRTLEKSQSNIDFHDLEGFKDLGIREVIKKDQARSPDLSKAWIVQSYAGAAHPLNTNRTAKTSTEDMKAQIKFWARAVATNVRQEC
ncbi:hypothetical protein SLE2022_344340 [Rubroshorea leprosula]